MTGSTHQSSGFSEHDRAFLQRRVGRFGLMAGSMFGGFLIFRFFFALAQGYPLFAQAEAWWHLAASLAFLVVWMLCRTGRRSPRFVRAVDGAGLLTGCGAALMMGIELPMAARPDNILTMALSMAIMARAIYVPSTGRRTAVYCLVVGAGLLATVAFVFRNFDPSQWAVLGETAPSSSFEAVISLTVTTAAWWTLVTVLASMASRTIYGLRREIRDGRHFGQYRLEEKLGEGGMGKVYRASHAMLRRPTAIKLLRPERAGEENLRRFEREVQLTAQLRHPNTITVFDYGRSHDGVFYYAMELVDGVTVEQLVDARGALPPGRVIHLACQVTAALVEAHGIGLIHRDIKPANIMVRMLHDFGGAHEWVKVLDFGLVKQLDQEVGASLTQANQVTGTPLYMAPEAITDSDGIDGRSDLYALGAVMYFCLTGTHVFSGNNVVEICSHHLHTQPEPPSDRLGQRLPEDLEQLVMSCLAKSRDDRPDSARALLQQLSACRDARTWTDADASAWWSLYGAALKRKPAASATPGELTVDVRRVVRDGNASPPSA